MPAMTGAVLTEFLQQPLVAVLSTVTPGGSPHSAPVWFEYEAGSFYVWTDVDSVKARNIARRGEAAICVATHVEPYRYVSASGAVEVILSEIRDRCLSISRRYYGEARALAFVDDDLARGKSVILVLTPRTLTSESAA